MGKTPILYSAYVGNLPFRATQEALYEMFEPYGNVWSVYIHEPEAALRHTYGFVRFTDIESRDTAVAALKGSFLLGQLLTIEKSRQDVPGFAAKERPLCDSSERLIKEKGEISSRHGDNSKEKEALLYRLWMVKDAFAKHVAKQPSCDAGAFTMHDLMEELQKTPYGLVSLDEPAIAPVQPIDTCYLQKQLLSWKESRLEHEHVPSTVNRTCESNVKTAASLPQKPSDVIAAFPKCQSTLAWPSDAEHANRMLKPVVNKESLASPSSCAVEDPSAAMGKAQASLPKGRGRTIMEVLLQ